MDFTPRTLPNRPRTVAVSATITSKNVQSLCLRSVLRGEHGLPALPSTTLLANRGGHRENPRRPSGISHARLLHNPAAFTLRSLMTTGFAMSWWIAGTARPQIRFLSVGDGLRLRLPSHPYSRRRGCLRLVVSVISVAGTSTHGRRGTTGVHDESPVVHRALIFARSTGRASLCCPIGPSIIPDMSGIPAPPAPAPSFSGSSATIASVVRMFLAIDAAFCRAERVTIAGSMTPAATRSTISLVEAFRPKPFLGLAHVVDDNRALKARVLGQLTQRLL